MGFRFCQPRLSGVVETKSAAPAGAVKRELTTTSTEVAGPCSSASEYPPLIELHHAASGGSGEHSHAGAAPDEPQAESVEHRSSAPRSSRCEADGCPLWSPASDVVSGKEELASQDGLPRPDAVIPASILTFSPRRDSDATSLRRPSVSVPAASSSSGTNAFSPRGIRAGKPTSLSITDTSTPADGTATHANSISGPVDSCYPNSILRPTSGWADCPSPLVPNRPPSTDHRSSSQSSGPPSTLMPRRGSVRFLGSSDDDDVETGGVSQVVEAYEWNAPSAEATEAKSTDPSPSLSGASSATTQSTRQRLPRSIMPAVAPAGVSGTTPPLIPAAPPRCSPPPMGVSVSRETPSPWLSVEEPPSVPVHHNGVFDGLAPFCLSDNSDRSGVFSGDGGSGVLPPAAALAPTAAGASQSPKSILLRPSANNSGAGCTSSPQSLISPLWPESVAGAASRRMSRRRLSEQSGALAEKHPSFTTTLPRHRSASRQQRLSRGEDSSDDDERIIASVRSVMMRLQRTDGAGSLSGSCSAARKESGLSSVDGNTRALQAAAAMSTAMFASPQAFRKRSESRPTTSSTGTSDTGRTGSLRLGRSTSPEQNHLNTKSERMLEGGGGDGLAG
ncbi:hypothetical protein NESM_000217100 [Novymonas esmeraldas]|uniref:Uncharacterized protein n=1 Tax=Novymonas esmeraldas TaxID=1808958 RepID=A0AAW0F7E5_9TRYP